MNPMTTTDGQSDQVLGSAYQVIKYVAANMETFISLAESIDPLVDSMQTAFEALRRTYAEAGLELLKATFDTGAAIVTRSQVLIDSTTGIAYSWGGELPYFVPQNSTVASTGGIGPTAWIAQDLTYLRAALASPDGVLLVGGAASVSQLTALENSLKTIPTSTEAKTKSDYVDGQPVYLLDLGSRFVFRQSRYLIAGQPESEMTFDDDLHILVDSGGMLQFDDFSKVRAKHTLNAARFAAALKDVTTTLTMDCYGDSITFGQALPGTDVATNKIGSPTGFGDGSVHEHWQYNASYPAFISDFLTKNRLGSNAVNNFGYSGDRAITGYLRHRGASGSLAATIMYGVNDCNYGTSNGSNLAGLSGAGTYSVANYAKALRLFVAKQILHGKYVTVLGTPPFAGLSGFDGTQLASAQLARAYNAAAKQVAAEFGCRYVDVCQDVFAQYGIMEITQEGTHLGEAGLKIAGSRIAASLVSIETENRVGHGSTLLANPGLVRLLSKDSVNVLPNSNATTPKGALDDTGADERTSLSVSGNWISIPFYAETDSLIAFINGSASVAGAEFDIRLDDGALQSDFHFQHDFFGGKPTSQKRLIANGPFNRDNCNVTGDSSSTLHIANKGWHTLSIRKVSGDSSLLLDSISFLSSESVISSDVYGVTAHCAVSAGALDGDARNVTSVSQEYPGEFSVAFTHKLSNNHYTIMVDVNESDANPITITTRYKTTTTCGIAFNRWTGSAWERFVPALFTVKVLGGR